uniref:SPK domain-containing protein n=1 Tax=Caenorhabditis tropicalis TaxID=1561998 RepID=A0A1I7TBT7_9PELO
MTDEWFSPMDFLIGLYPRPVAEVAKQVANGEISLEEGMDRFAPSTSNASEEGASARRKRTSRAAKLDTPAVETDAPRRRSRRGAKKEESQPFTEEQQSSMSSNEAMQKIVELRNAPKTTDREQTISRLTGEVCNLFCSTLLDVPAFQAKFLIEKANFSIEEARKIVLRSKPEDCKLLDIYLQSLPSSSNEEPSTSTATSLETSLEIQKFISSQDGINLCFRKIVEEVQTMLNPEEKETPKPRRSRRSKALPAENSGDSLPEHKRRRRSKKEDTTDDSTVQKNSQQEKNSAEGHSNQVEAQISVGQGEFVESPITVVDQGLGFQEEHRMEVDEVSIFLVDQGPLRVATPVTIVENSEDSGQSEVLEAAKEIHDIVREIGEEPDLIQEFIEPTRLDRKTEKEQPTAEEETSGSQESIVPIQELESFEAPEEKLITKEGAESTGQETRSSEGPEEERISEEFSESTGQETKSSEAPEEEMISRKDSESTGQVTKSSEAPEEELIQEEVSESTGQETKFSEASDELEEPTLPKNVEPISVIEQKTEKTRRHSFSCTTGSISLADQNLSPSFSNSSPTVSPSFSNSYLSANRPSSSQTSSFIPKGSMADKDMIRARESRQSEKLVETAEKSSQTEENSSISIEAPTQLTDQEVEYVHPATQEIPVTIDQEPQAEPGEAEAAATSNPVPMDQEMNGVFNQDELKEYRDVRNHFGSCWDNIEEIPDSKSINGEETTEPASESQTTEKISNVTQIREMARELYEEMEKFKASGQPGWSPTLMSELDKMIHSTDQPMAQESIEQRIGTPVQSESSEEPPPWSPVSVNDEMEADQLHEQLISAQETNKFDGLPVSSQVAELLYEPLVNSQVAEQVSEPPVRAQDIEQFDEPSVSAQVAELIGVQPVRTHVAEKFDVQLVRAQIAEPLHRPPVNARIAEQPEQPPVSSQNLNQNEVPFPFILPEQLPAIQNVQKRQPEPQHIPLAPVRHLPQFFIHAQPPVTQNVQSSTNQLQAPEPAQTPIQTSTLLRSFRFETEQPRGPVNHLGQPLLPYPNMYMFPQQFPIGQSSIMTQPSLAHFPMAQLPMPQPPMSQLLMNQIPMAQPQNPGQSQPSVIHAPPHPTRDPKPPRPPLFSVDALLSSSGQNPQMDQRPQVNHHAPRPSEAQNPLWTRGNPPPYSPEHNFRSMMNEPRVSQVPQPPTQPRPKRARQPKGAPPARRGRPPTNARAAPAIPAEALKFMSTHWKLREEARDPENSRRFFTESWENAMKGPRGKPTALFFWGASSFIRIMTEMKEWAVEDIKLEANTVDFLNSHRQYCNEELFRPFVKAKEKLMEKREDLEKEEEEKYNLVVRALNHFSIWPQSNFTMDEVLRFINCVLFQEMGWCGDVGSSHIIKKVLEDFPLST